MRWPLGALYLALADVAHFFDLLFDYAFLSPANQTKVRSEAVTTIIKALDVFLISSLLIVAFGLYGLFVGKIDVAERSEVASRLLKIETLEELKERVAKLLVVILVVEFFQRALGLTYHNALDILYLAAAILLVSGALYLTGRRSQEELSKPANEDAEGQRAGR